MPRVNEALPPDAETPKWLKLTEPANWHPAAAAFPRMSETELRDLADDLNVNDQYEPIVVLDGQVLDGINRLLAHKLLWDAATNKEDVGDPYIVFYVSYNNKGKKRIAASRVWINGSPTEYVISHNIHRRHMTYDQRVAVASELAELLKEEGKERRKAHLKQGNKTPVVPKSAPRERAVEQAAQKLDVGKDAVQVVTTAEKENPGTREKLKTGLTTVAQVRKERTSTKGEPPAGEIAAALIKEIYKHLSRLKAGVTGYLEYYSALDDPAAGEDFLDHMTEELMVIQSMLVTARGTSASVAQHVN